MLAEAVVGKVGGNKVCRRQVCLQPAWCSRPEGREEPGRTGMNNGGPVAGAVGVAGWQRGMR